MTLYRCTCERDVCHADAWKIKESLFENILSFLRSWHNFLDKICHIAPQTSALRDFHQNSVCIIFDWLTDFLVLQIYINYVKLSNDAHRLPFIPFENHILQFLVNFFSSAVFDFRLYSMWYLFWLSQEKQQEIIRLSHRLFVLHCQQLNFWTKEKRYWRRGRTPSLDTFHTSGRRCVVRNLIELAGYWQCI